jgi:tocopherol cyclase
MSDCAGWTPHSGYHWDGSLRRFFEGWYFRLTLPELGESVAFMYSIDDPAGHSPVSGGAAQVLGLGETYLYHPFPDVDGFWAWRGRLGLGHWGAGSPRLSPPPLIRGAGGIATPSVGPADENCLSSKEASVKVPLPSLGEGFRVRATPGKSTHPPRPRYLPPEVFNTQILWGYQVTATQHQGALRDVTTGQGVRWQYTVEPRYGWGTPGQPPQPTAGWLSYLPVFEPGWQVLMAHGWATGWLDWDGRRHEFTRAPVYAEKNWGGAFPEKWFWIQCNAFEGEPDLALTVAAGRRQVLNRMETVGLVGLHYREQCLIWTSFQHEMGWQVQPWGHWRVTASNHRYRIEIEGRCDAPPATVRVPTREGLQCQCWDTTHGHLTLRLRTQPNAPASAPPLALDAVSDLAGLEVGGQGWEESWEMRV